MSAREPSFLEPPEGGLAFHPRQAIGTSARHLLVRFAFGAATSAVSAGVAIAFGARAGGIFLAFPAILAATVTLIEGDEGSKAAREDARGAIVGSLALIAFAGTGAALFTGLPGGAVLAIAAGVWGTAAVGLYLTLWRAARRREAVGPARAVPRAGARVESAAERAAVSAPGAPAAGGRDAEAPDAEARARAARVPARGPAPRHS